MTVDASTPGSAGDGVAGSPVDGPPAVVPTVGLETVGVVQVAPPRPGELTPRWRFLVAVVWIAVAVAQGAVWKTSDQLGMSTWWLGPRGEPRPLFVQLLPFVPALAMVLAAANRVRLLAWWGAVAAALVIAVGVADLAVMPELGWVEIAIGAAAMVVSFASRAGAYRRAPEPAA